MDSAATKIQSVFRGHRARTGFVDKVFESAWRELDGDDERELISRDSEIEDVCGELQALGLRPKKHKRSPHSPRDDGQRVHLPDSLDLSAVSAMMDSFAGGSVLNYSDGMMLICQMQDMLKLLPSIVDVSVPIDGRLVVCGDTHGQFADLRAIFRVHGWPSEKNLYLFNGDFVDRGPNGAEVFLSLFALKLVFPKYLFLNRGNHEARRLNERYGFEREILEKFDAEFFDAVQDTFKMLPLGHVVERQVLVVHGGLSGEHNVTLDELRSIDRMASRRGHTEKSREDILMEALLWSDPRPIVGVQDSHRGAGVEFGSDVTHDFLERNKLRLLIRSHEMMEEGYQCMHADKLITVFSASYYCGKNENFGAVIHLTHCLDAPDKLMWTFSTYKASKNDFAELVASHRAVMTVAYPEYWVSREEETLQKLRERIYENRHLLLECFSAGDEGKTGLVSRERWAVGVAQCLNLPRVPWFALQPYLASATPDGSIPYLAFCRRYQIRCDEGFCARWRRRVFRRICDRIFTRQQTLSSAFAELDKDRDGVVTYDEFTTYIRTLNLGLTDEQLFDLARGFDVNGSGRGFDYTAFMRAFQPEFNVLQRTRSEQMLEIAGQSGSGSESEDDGGAQGKKRAAGGATAEGGEAAGTEGESGTSFQLFNAVEDVRSLVMLRADEIRKVRAGFVSSCHGLCYFRLCHFFPFSVLSPFASQC